MADPSAPTEDISFEQSLAQQAPTEPPTASPAPADGQTQDAPDAGPAPAAPAEDPLAFEKGIATDTENLRQLHAAQLQYAADHNNDDPNEVAEVQRLSGVTGQTPLMVKSNLPAVRAFVKANATKADWNLMTYRQPGLVKMLTANPAVIPAVKDDAATLGGLEWAMTAPFHRFWDATVEEMAIRPLQFNEAMGAADSGPENRARIKELEAKYSNKDYGQGEGKWANAAIATAGMVPYIGLNMLATAMGSGIGGFLGGTEAAAAGGAATAPVGGEGAVPAAVAGGLTSAAMGGFISAGLFNTYEALGPNYERLSEMKDSEGNPLDPNLVSALALGSATLTGTMMSGPLGKIGGGLTKGLMARFGFQTAEKVIADAGAATLMKRMAMGFGKEYLTGAALMAGMGAINQTTVELAKSASGQPFEPEAGSAGSRIASATGDAFIGGLKDMWLVSGLGAAVEHGPGVYSATRDLITGVGRDRISAEGAARYDVMTKAAAESKLLERSPELFEKAVRSMAGEPDATTHVYIPADKWTDYWQSKKVDPTKMAADIMGDEGKGYAEALGTKGDIAIPTEKYFSKLGKTEHTEGLAQDVKMRPEDSTPRQFAERQKLNEKDLAAAAKRRPEVEEGKAEVRKYIRDMAVKAGDGSKESRAEADGAAKMVADNVGTMALKLNISIAEAASRGNLGGLRILGPKGESVIRATVEHFQEFLRPSSERLLEKRLASMSPAARAKEATVDNVTGLRERAAFDATPVPEGGLVSVITSPDAKGINDHPTAGGHNVTNDMLRATGAAIGENHPEAARAGTNFVAHVKSEAEHADLLERAKKGLGNENLNLVGATGKTADEAFANLRTETDRRRGELKDAEGKPIEPKPEEKLPARGGLNPNLDVAGLKFSAERAKGTAPEGAVEHFAKMTDEEYAHEVYADKVKVGGKEIPTGLLTGKAWDALPPHEHVVMADAKGLKDINTKYGEEEGNRFLFHIADAFAHFGGSSFDATHKSGDEFVFGTHDKTPERLQQYIEQVAGILKRTKLEMRNRATGELEQVSLDFRHGTGRDLDAADRDLNTKKRAEPPKEPVGVAADLRREASDGVRGQPRDVAGKVEGAPEQGGSAEEVVPPQSLAERGQGATRFFQKEVIAHVEGTPVVFGNRNARGDTSFNFGDNALKKDGRAYVDGLKDPEKQSAANAFIDWAEGKTPPEDRVVIPPDLERQLGKFGWVDPVDGYPFDENGRDKRVVVKYGADGKGPRGELPDSLAEAKHNRSGAWWTKYNQEPTAWGSVNDIVDAQKDHERATESRLADLDAQDKSLYEFNDRYGKGKVVVSKDPSKPGKWRATWFGEDGEPHGHTEAPDRKTAFQRAIDHDADLGIAPMRSIKLKQENRGPVWYSAVDRAVGQAKQEKNTAAAWLSVIEKSSGVKKEELDFMGLREWLKEQKGSVTRADIQKFVDAHKVEVTEQELAPSPNGAVNGDVAQYENYTLGGHAPGTYKELLFHAPGTTADAYQAPHFGQDGKGLLAHARISEHVGKDGKPLLFVEEIQSDLHQAAREKGYERRTDKPKQLLEKRHAAGDAFISVARDAGLADGPARQIARDIREDYADGKMDGKQLGAVEGVSAEGLKAIDAAGRKLREADLAWRAEESKATTGQDRRIDPETAMNKVAKWLETDDNGYDVRKDTKGKWGVVGRNGSWGPEFNTREEALADARADVSRYRMHAGSVSQHFLETAKAPADVMTAFERHMEPPEKRVPDAPFKTTWDEMVAKRLIRYAAEKGYEKIGWTTGDTQAARYDLAKRVGEIRYNPETKDFHVLDHEGDNIQGVPGTVEPKDLAGIIGKESAEKLLKARMDGEYHSLKGPDMKLGGEGMKTAYDRRIPSVFEKLVKKYGGEVSKEKIEAAQPKYHVGEREHDGWPVVDPSGDIVQRGFVTREAAEGEVAQSNFRHGKNGSNRSHDAWAVTLPEELRKAVLREGMPLFSKGRNEGEGERGSISLQLDPNGRPRELKITAFAGDKSTLMHETAHFLSWSFHDIAESDLATPQIKEDYAALLKWAGYGSTKERLYATKEVEKLAQKGELTRSEEAQMRKWSAGEERIAHGFEQFLLEGKAPNTRLASVFSKFRGWLLGIYGGIKGIQSQYQRNYGQPLDLSDSVRDIFDRLLGQDEALRRARVATGDVVEGPRPPPIPTAGMTPEEREAFFAARQASNLVEEQEVAKRQSELEGEQVSDVRAAFTKQVTQELDKQPVYRAERYLQHGELVDGQGNVIDVPDILLTEDGKTMKLDRADFVKQFGKDAAATMPPGIFEKGGVKADEIAPLLGFTDGADMVETFGKTDLRDRAISKQVQDKLNDAYAPALGELAKAAMGAIHNEHSAYATLLALRAAARQVDPASAARVHAIDPKVMRDSARRLINEKGVGDLDPDSYAANEKRAAERAAFLHGKGDHAGALEQQLGRFWNQLLYRAARDAQDRAEKAQAKMEKTSQDIRANLGKAEPAYRDLHDGILHAVGLGPEPGANAQGLDQMLAVADTNGHDPSEAFDVDAIRKVLEGKYDWDQLSVREAANVGDAITYLRHIANTTNEIETAGKKVSKLALAKAIADRTASVQKPQPRLPYSRTAEKFIDKARKVRRSGQALLENMETWAEMLDGGTKGPVHDLFIGDRIACRTVENDITAKVLKPIKEAFDKIPKDIQKLKDRIEDVSGLLPVKSDTLAPVFTRDTLWRLFMAYTSDGNRQRLNDGNGWSNENIEKVLSRLHETELDFLQVLKDVQTQHLYPKLAEAYEKRTGLPLGKVDALPVTINGKTYAGGYDAIRYDSRMSQQGQRQEANLEADSIKGLFGGSYQKPTLPTSHTKQRVEKVNAPLDLSWGMVPAHLSQVIRDIAYGEWVRQTGSILLAKQSSSEGPAAPTFQDTATKFLGPERAKEFIPWLRDVANARADSAAAGINPTLRAAGNITRSTLARFTMGFNLPSLTRHLFDPYSSIADTDQVGLHHTAAAYVKVMYPGNWNRPEYADSKEISNHEAQLHDNLRAEMGKIGPDGESAFSRIADAVAFYAHGKVHHFTARVVFTAAHDKALSEGATPAEAIQAGDDILRRHIPSGDMADKSPLARTKYGAASAVMYYGYASLMHNVRARAFDEVVRAYEMPGGSPRSPMEAAIRFAGKYLALGAIGAVGTYFAGRAWKRQDDKPKDAALWLAEEIALDPLDGIALVGPATKKVITGGIDTVVKGHADFGHEVNIASSPELAFAGQMLTRVQLMIERAASSKKTSDADKVWATVEMLATAMMGAEGQRLVGDANAQRKHEFRPKGPVGQVEGAFYGAPKTNGSSAVNPLQHLQKAGLK